MLLGDMQDWKPNVASIIEYAADIYPESEVVSKLVSGEVHRTNYKEVCVRSRKLASKLVKDGYKQGDVIATLALNTFRHLEAYYGVSGMGAVVHTLNFRLHPEQAVYIINHAEDKVIFVEAPFVPILEALQENLSTVEKYIVFCDKHEMPESTLKNCISYEDILRMVMKILYGQIYLTMQLVVCVIHLEQQGIQREFYIHINQLFFMQFLLLDQKP